MSQIPPIGDAYIDEIIKAIDPYDSSLNKTQGIKLRELIKLMRDRMEQEVTRSIAMQQTYIEVVDASIYINPRTYFDQPTNIFVNRNVGSEAVINFESHASPDDKGKTYHIKNMGVIPAIIVSSSGALFDNESSITLSQYESVIIMSLGLTAANGLEDRWAIISNRAKVIDDIRLLPGNDYVEVDVLTYNDPVVQTDNVWYISNYNSGSFNRPDRKFSDLNSVFAFKFTEQSKDLIVSVKNNIDWSAPHCIAIQIDQMGLVSVVTNNNINEALPTQPITGQFLTIRLMEDGVGAGGTESLFKVSILDSNGGVKFSKNYYVVNVSYQNNFLQFDFSQLTRFYYPQGYGLGVVDGDGEMLIYGAVRLTLPVPWNKTGNIYTRTDSGYDIVNKSLIGDGSIAIQFKVDGNGGLYIGNEESLGFVGVNVVGGVSFRRDNVVGEVAFNPQPLLGQYIAIKRTGAITQAVIYTSPEEFVIDHTWADDFVSFTAIGVEGSAASKVYDPQLKSLEFLPDMNRMILPSEDWTEVDDDIWTQAPIAGADLYIGYTMEADGAVFFKYKNNGSRYGPEIDLRSLPTGGKGLYLWIDDGNIKWENSGDNKGQEVAVGGTFYGLIRESGIVKVVKTLDGITFIQLADFGDVSECIYVGSWQYNEITNKTYYPQGKGLVSNPNP